MSDTPLLRGKVGVNRLSVWFETEPGLSLRFVRETRSLWGGHEVTEWSQPLAALCEVKVRGLNVTLILDHPHLGHRHHAPYKLKVADEEQARAAHTLAELARASRASG